MTDTAVQRLTDALPANPALDGPIGVDSTDLRNMLSRLVDVTTLGDQDQRYALGQGE